MSFEYGDIRKSLNNRNDFLGELKVDYRNLVCCHQVHGNKVTLVDERDNGRGSLGADTALTDTDALITNRLNLPIAIFTADCLPVFLYDPQNHAIGLAHAGWEGTKEKIASQTVELMRKEFNTNPVNLRVSFGPAIRECCYEVKDEFKNYFPFGIKKRGSRYFFDIVSVNKVELLNSGVEEGNIIDQKNCTFCSNDKFFSYRKEGKDAGRMMSIMMLK